MANGGKFGPVIGRVAVLAVLLALVGCGTESERVIEPGELSRGVSEALTSAGKQHDDVQCPDSVRAQIAESVKCTMAADGKRYEVTVVIKDVQGDQATYDVDVAPQPLP